MCWVNEGMDPFYKWENWGPKRLSVFSQWENHGWSPCFLSSGLITFLREFSREIWFLNIHLGISVMRGNRQTFHEVRTWGESQVSPIIPNHLRFCKLSHYSLSLESNKKTKLAFCFPNSPRQSDDGSEWTVAKLLIISSRNRSRRINVWAINHKCKTMPA